MKMKALLEKQLPNLVGKNVNVKETVVGKVTEYDSETGLATIEIDDDTCSKICWNPLAGRNIGICSREFLDKSDEKIDTSDGEVCPECGAPIIEKNSGIKCSKCNWWFCY